MSRPGEAFEILQVPLGELLRIWGELVEAEHGVHSFGGDTAEIYAYRLMHYSPVAELAVGDSQSAAKRERASAAARSLTLICMAFEEDRGVLVTIDGARPGAWCKRDGSFDHRAHVRVRGCPPAVQHGAV